MRALFFSVLTVFLFTIHAQAQFPGWLPIGGAGGGYTFDLYSPKTPAANPGLVLLLHGCLQSSKQVMTQSHFATEAERKGFYIMVPQQSSTNNALSCWNWFEPSQQNRSLSGDTAYIMKNLEKIITDKGIDRSKVFIAGFSSGAAMASNMISCFGDVFKGALIHSGLEFGAATSMGEAFSVMRTGPNRSVDKSAALAFHCMPSHTAMTPVMIAHGASDSVVNPVNFQRLVRQFEIYNQDIANEIGVSPTVTSSKSRVNGSGLGADVTDEMIAGKVVIKAILVDRMSHAWSGGDASVQYSEPRGPNVTEIFSEMYFPQP